IPGDWNNVSACCGTAGQARFFLSMYRLTKDRRYLELANRAAELLVSKATTDADRPRWVHAQKRKQPDPVMAQTGLMQGCWGIGLWLLHAAGFRDGRELPMSVLPDDPFEF